MDEAYDRLCAILEATGLQYFRQGSLLKDEPYPEGSFLTFWEAEADEEYKDNIPISCTHRFWVYYYTAKRATVAPFMKSLREAFHDDGFTTTPPTDAKSDERSYVGKAIEVLIKIFY